MSARKFEPYPAYKDSGVEWLGEIPTHWDLKRLRSTITDCLNGVWGEEPNGINDIACVRVADFDRIALRVNMVEPTLRSIDKAVIHTRGLHAGDLLLEKSGGGENQPVGAVVLYDNNRLAVCSNFIARVTVPSTHNSRFLTYLHAALYALRINTRHIKQSTGIQNLDSSSYFGETVGLPAGNEQRAIATFLDRETTRIDALVAKKERLIELLQEKRTSLITQAVTKGRDLNVPMKDSGVEWFGQIPAHWEVRRLSHLTNPAIPIVYGILLPGPRLEDGVPYIGAGDVEAGRLRRDSLPRTTNEIALQYPRSRMLTGEIVYAIRGSFGAVEVIPPELDGVNLSRDAARIAPRSGVSVRWLCWALRSSTSQKQFEFNELGATITGVNIRDLKRVVLACPPSVEQAHISSFLEYETAKIDTLIDKVSEGINKLKEYRTALISAAVTGKIDVREEVA